MSNSLDPKVTIELKPTERGFLRGSFTDRYGMACHIQKSSLATEDCIWLGADEIGLQEFVARRQPSAWEPVVLENTLTHHYNANTCMHLTQAQVQALLLLLQHFAETGELPASPRGVSTDG